MSTRSMDLNPEDRLVPHIAEHYPPEPNYTAVAGGDWPEPQTLPDGLPSVQSYSPALLPEALRTNVDDVADRMQVPADLPAAVAIVTLAACVGRRAAIQPKARDTGWLVTPNLWGEITARPGYMKSPILSELTAPLRAVESKWRDEHISALRIWQTDKERNGAALKKWQADYKKNGDGAGEPPELRPAPTCQRVLLNDSTPEKLQAILAENPGGILVLRDELTGLLTLLDRKERAGERQFYLESWNGNSSYTVDRISRGTVHIPAACVSLFGGMQPARLRAYMGGALRDGAANDGLMQRLQVLVWPDDPSTEWRHIDRPPNDLAREAYAKTLTRLLELPLDEPLVLRFDADAQALFNEWWRALEHELRGGDLPDYLTSHFAKYRSLMPTLAGLYELAEWVHGRGDNEIIGLVSTRRAAATCDYLRSHALRAYACQPQASIEAARTLLRRINEGSIGPGRLGLRDVYRHHWSGLAKPEEARAACGVLVEYGWLQLLVSDTRVKGRPSEEYAIHPEAHL